MYCEYGQRNFVNVISTGTSAGEKKIHVLEEREFVYATAIICVLEW